MNPQDISYSKSVVDLVRDFLSASEYGNIFKEIYYGNPPNGIPIDSIPCIAVIKDGTTVVQGATGMDDITYKLMLRVVINKKDYLTNGAWDVVLDQRRMEQIIEGENPSTGLYDNTSIIGILRTNFTLNNYSVDQKIDVTYGETRNPFINEATREAQIRLTVSRLILTPGKQ